MVRQTAGKLGGDVNRLIESYTEAYRKSGASPKFEKTEAGKAILKLELSDQVAVLHAVFDAVSPAVERYAVIAHRLDESYEQNGFENRDLDLESDWSASLQSQYAVNHLAAALLRRGLPLTATDLDRCCAAAMNSRTPWPEYWPVFALVAAIQCFAKNNEIPKRLQRTLSRFMGFVGGGDYAETRKLAARIGTLIGEQKGAPDIVLVASEWSRCVRGFVNGQGKKTEKLWTTVFKHAIEIQDQTKPTAKWLEVADARIAELGAAAFASALNEWFAPCTPDTIYQEPNTDLMKALIWVASRVEDDRMPTVLGRLGETCYKKVPGVGPANVKLGNACIHSLGKMPGERAVAELVRLKSRIKFNNGRKKLDGALTAAAERRGLTVADLEEIALPTFGLDVDGRRTAMLGEIAAEIRMAGSDEVTLNWTGADGKPRKSVPASVKANHADALKELRGETREIKGVLAGQRWRLESLYLQERSWPFADWRRRYLEHPLMANLARRLIWTFGDAAAVPCEDGFIGPDDKPVNPAADTTVSLWHPIEATAQDVLAWRRRLAALDITQPFKQAHREVYLLTDPERETRTYSNRFAAHILRQHQMNALCQARGWRYALQGAWDQEQSVPTRALPGGGCAEFWVDYASDDHLDNGVYVYRATDQVRFLDETGEPLRLETVPPLVFSEVMRDVDLFVGVASVGNNPEWQDGGPEGRFRDYWWGFSFGELGETAKTRKAVLEALLPRLKIADRCELKDKFLLVRGTRRTYKIHLGSGNILMAPNDAYLCIVPDQSKAAKGGANVRLPFEGDRTLSLILSKAFLLAADDKITDRTILSQIKG